MNITCAVGPGSGRVQWDPVDIRSSTWEVFINWVHCLCCSAPYRIRPAADQIHNFTITLHITGVITVPTLQDIKKVFLCQGHAAASSPSTCVDNLCSRQLMNTYKFNLTVQCPFQATFVSRSRRWNRLCPIVRSLSADCMWELCYTFVWFVKHWEKL